MLIRPLVLVFVLVVLVACGGGDSSTVLSRSSPSLSVLKTVTLSTETEGGSARPEVIATDSRVFVVYLGHITGGMSTKSLDVKVYDAALSSELTSTTIVPPTEAYGSATDIRIARDGQNVFTFYETSTTTTTYLHGAKYSLNDSFDLVARTAAPIASSMPVFQAKEGDEVLNDPAPLVGPDSVFVVTRLMSSISTTGNTVYRVRELSKDTLAQIDQFDLDLSDVANGRGRVASLLFWNNAFYMALATTVSDQGLNEQSLMSDDGAQCDILLVRMSTNWTYDPQTDVRTISGESGDRENYITGLRVDDTYVYLTYKQAVGGPPTGEQRAMIKIFDTDLNLLSTKVARSVSWGGTAGEIRPSLDVYGTSLYSGQSVETSMGHGNAQIIVYEIQ